MNQTHVQLSTDAALTLHQQRSPAQTTHSIFMLFYKLHHRDLYLTTSSADQSAFFRKQSWNGLTTQRKKT